MGSVFGLLRNLVINDLKTLNCAQHLNLQGNVEIQWTTVTKH